MCAHAGVGKIRSWVIDWSSRITSDIYAPPEEIAWLVSATILTAELAVIAASPIST
jgi:hypothetical protein